MGKIQSERNNNFGTLHLLAAIFILYGHQCVLLNKVTPFIFGCQIHAIGVKIIFLISGYLITKSLLSESVDNISYCKIFALKRLGRLYPEYVFCLLITAVLIGPFFTTLPLGDYFTNDVWKQYILNNIRLFPTYNLAGVFIDNPYSGAVNGSLWTMPAEIFMYVVLLLFGIVFRKWKKRNVAYGILTVIVVLTSLLRFLMYPNARYVFYGTDWIAALNIIPYVLVGGLFYVFDFRKLLNVQVALVISLVISMCSYNSEVTRELVSLLILPYIVFSLGLSSEQQLKLRVLKGEYAYGIYLWGFVVQQCLVQVFVVRFRCFESVTSLFIISLVITYILAAFSYEAVYIPFGKITKNAITKVRSRAKI